MAASDAKKIIKWQGSLTIEKADALKQEFLQAFDSAKEILLDISAIEDIDTAIIQLIFSAGKEAAKRGVKFQVDKNISPAVMQFLKLLNLELSVKQDGY